MRKILIKNLLKKEVNIFFPNWVYSINFFIRIARLCFLLHLSKIGKNIIEKFNMVLIHSNIEKLQFCEI
jgi:hypothetical protein